MPQCNDDQWGKSMRIVRLSYQTYADCSGEVGEIQCSGIAKGDRFLGHSFEKKKTLYSNCFLILLYGWPIYRP